MSSECFITESLGLGSQPLQCTRQLFGFQQRLYFVLSPLCHLKRLSVLSRSQWRHSLFTVNDCCPQADCEVNHEGTPLNTTYSFTVFLAAYNKLDAAPVTFKNSLLFLTPSVHKTVMRCCSSCALFTENCIVEFTKYVQLHLISFYLTFIIEIH